MNNGGVHMSDEGHTPRELISRSDLHGSENKVSVPAEDIRLKVEELSIYYGDFRAVNNVNMSVRTNQVTAIIGPSGCGKSTFVRCLNRMHEVVLETRVTGRVLLEGEDIYGHNVNPVRVRQRIGMVFQKANPFPTMSIRDNVLAGMYLQGRRAPDMDGRVEKALHPAARGEGGEGGLR